MSAVVSAPLLTAAEFARLPDPADGSKQELYRGRIVTMPPPGFRHGEVQLNVGTLVRVHVRAAKLGRTTVESGVVTESGPDTVRGPDVAYWSYERLPADQHPAIYPDVPADLCVEVLSPSNTVRGMTRKVREYFAAGVRLVWVIDPDERTVTVYTAPGDGRVLWDDATLDGGAVLPGFSAKVEEFFR